MSMSDALILEFALTLSSIISASASSTSPEREFDILIAFSVISSSLEISFVYANPQAPFLRTLILAPVVIPESMFWNLLSFINMLLEFPFKDIISA